MTARLYKGSKWARASWSPWFHELAYQFYFESRKGDSLGF